MNAEDLAKRTPKHPLNSFVLPLDVGRPRE
jgi:hypothetical protein